MSSVQFVGRPSLNFYGKYLSEIVKQLKNRGVGRVVVKGSERDNYKEPCFYILEKAVPLMSDKSHVRIRAWGRRVYRGHDFGHCLLPKTHEPDWYLIDPIEASSMLANLESKTIQKADYVDVPCTAPMPPLLATYLQTNGSLSKETLKAVATNSRGVEGVSSTDDGLLLLTRHPDDPTLFLNPITPSPDEQSRIHPPFATMASRDDGLIRRRNLSNRDFYYIRRRDTPGLYWKVELSPSQSTTPTVLSPSEARS